MTPTLRMPARTVLDVQVLTVTDCPHRDLTMDRVRQALDRVGARRVRVTERVIDDPADAVVAGMHGSPTVLIGGRDPFGAGQVEASVSCRLYPTAAGFDGAPGVTDLIAALSGQRATTAWRNILRQAGAARRRWPPGCGWRRRSS